MLTLFIALLVVVARGSGPTFQTVAIIGTNDLHGGAFPTAMFRSDTNESYNYGGLEFMAHMIETVKNEYKGNVLYLDAGDQFQGGI
jgi:2',3'-cyclic-nucleotide 2'-phosphodiesterase (5'-nucleotidase family)